VAGIPLVGVAAWGLAGALSRRVIADESAPTTAEADSGAG